MADAINTLLTAYYSEEEITPWLNTAKTYFESQPAYSLIANQYKSTLVWDTYLIIRENTTATEYYGVYINIKFTIIAPYVAYYDGSLSIFNV